MATLTPQEAVERIAVNRGIDTDAARQVLADKIAANPALARDIPGVAEYLATEPTLAERAGRFANRFMATIAQAGAYPLSLLPGDIGEYGKLAYEGAEEYLRRTPQAFMGEELVQTLPFYAIASGALAPLGIAGRVGGLIERGVLGARIAPPVGTVTAEAVAGLAPRAQWAARLAGYGGRAAQLASEVALAETLLGHPENIPTGAAFGAGLPLAGAAFRKPLVAAPVIYGLGKALEQAYGVDVDDKVLLSLAAAPALARLGTVEGRTFGPTVTRALVGGAGGYAAGAMLGGNEVISAIITAGVLASPVGPLMGRNARVGEAVRWLAAKTKTATDVVASQTAGELRAALQKNQAPEELVNQLDNAIIQEGAAEAQKFGGAIENVRAEQRRKLDEPLSALRQLEILRNAEEAARRQTGEVTVTSGKAAGYETTAGDIASATREGSTYRGRVLSATGDEVTLEQPSGTITLPRTSITSTTTKVSPEDVIVKSILNPSGPVTFVGQVDSRGLIHPDRPDRAEVVNFLNAKTIRYNNNFGLDPIKAGLQELGGRLLDSEPLDMLRDVFNLNQEALEVGFKALARMAKDAGYDGLIFVGPWGKQFAIKARDGEVLPAIERAIEGFNRLIRDADPSPENLFTKEALEAADNIQGWLRQVGRIPEVRRILQRKFISRHIELPGAGFSVLHNGSLSDYDARKLIKAVKVVASRLRSHGGSISIDVQRLRDPDTLAYLHLRHNPARMREYRMVINQNAVEDLPAWALVATITHELTHRAQAALWPARMARLLQKYNAMGREWVAIERSAISQEYKTILKLNHAKPMLSDGLVESIRQFVSDLGPNGAKYGQVLRGTDIFDASYILRTNANLFNSVLDETEHLPRNKEWIPWGLVLLPIAGTLLSLDSKRAEAAGPADFIDDIAKAAVNGVISREVAVGETARRAVARAADPAAVVDAARAARLAKPAVAAEIAAGAAGKPPNKPPPRGMRWVWDDSSQGWMLGMNLDPAKAMDGVPGWHEAMMAKGMKSFHYFRNNLNAPNDQRVVSKIAYLDEVLTFLATDKHNRLMTYRDIYLKAGIKNSTDEGEFANYLIEFFRKWNPITKKVEFEYQPLDEFGKPVPAEVIESRNKRWRDAAIRWFTEAHDEMFKLITGWHPNARPIMKHFGLDANEATTRQRLRFIQDNLFPNMPSDASDEDIAKVLAFWVTKGKDWDKIHPKARSRYIKEVQAARETKGLFVWDHTHDQSPKFVDGHVTQMPLRNEINDLSENIRVIRQSGITLGPDDEAKVAAMEDRLNKLRKWEDELSNRVFPSRYDPATGATSQRRTQFLTIAHLEQSDRYAMMDLPINLEDRMTEYVNAMYRKRFLDVARAEIRPLIEVLTTEGKPSTLTAAWVNDWLNAQRGVFGFRVDAAITNFINRLPTRAAKEFGYKDMHNLTRLLLGFNFATKIGLNLPRFVAMNLPQPFLTTLPVAGSSIESKFKNFMRGYGYVLRDPITAIRNAEVSGGIPSLKSGGFASWEEMGELRHTPLERLLALLKAGPTAMEAWNNTVAYNVGRIQVLTEGKNFKPHPAVRYFINKTDETLEEKAHRYGIAMRKMTQFSAEQTIRPLAFQAGMLGKLTGQFKTFMTSYWFLMEELYKTDPAGFAMAAAGLFLVGGFGTVPFYDQARLWLARRGINLPTNSGAYWLMHSTGLTTSPMFDDLTKHVDITSAFSFIQPEMGSTAKEVLGEVANIIGGPTVGTVAGAAAGLTELAGADPGGGLRTLASAISPVLLQGLDAYLEAVGPLRTPGGEAFADRPRSVPALGRFGPTYVSALRLLGLTTSPRMLRYQYMQELIAALEAKDMDTFDKLLTEARDLGLIFGPRSMATIKGTATKARKREHRPLRSRLVRPE